MLSEAQKSMLQYIAREDYADDEKTPNPTRRMLWRLAEGGLIKRGRMAWRLTEAGRRALKEQAR